jgi:hypothetical protein
VNSTCCLVTWGLCQREDYLYRNSEGFYCVICDLEIHALVWYSPMAVITIISTLGPNGNAMLQELFWAGGTKKIRITQQHMKRKVTRDCVSKTLNEKYHTKSTVKLSLQAHIWSNGDIHPRILNASNRCKRAAIVNLVELPDNRRLRRHLPNDLPTRFLA